MTSRERVRRALKRQSPDRAPRDLWTLPGVLASRAEEVRHLLERFPSDFTVPRFTPGLGRRCRGSEAVVGRYTDAWGSTWHVGQPGIVGEVKEPALKDWTSLDHYEPPWEIIREADLSRVKASCDETDSFVLAGTGVRPFERMQFLRGSENLFMDLAYGAAEVVRLRDMVHEFNVEEIRMWARTDVDGISFMDDWGTQSSLLVSPELWRSFFKPLYAEYCALAHGAGKFVFFHSDGYIRPIYPDLVEIGVDAVNSQLFCMDIEELGARFKGRIAFWGEIDRQKILPFGTSEEVRSAVRRVRHALDDGSGGVIAQCEWGINDPRQNVEAVFDEWCREPPTGL